jgi:RNA polymerase sigma-70 factor (ECF subfamily)
MTRVSDRAFEIVFHEHHRMVTAYLCSVVGDWAAAADLAQETFVVAYRRLDSFDASRPVGPWLRGIARNLALNYRRKHAHRQELPMDGGTIDALFGLFDLPRGDETWDERLRAMDTCIERLPLQQKTIVLQHYRDDESARSIAERLSLVEKTVFQTLWRARNNLRNCIEALLRGKEVPDEA